MANAVNAEYKKIEGIHVLADFEYRKYVRSTPVLACETCGKRQKDDGVEIKRCQAVCPFLLILQHVEIVF